MGLRLENKMKKMFVCEILIAGASVAQNWILSISGNKKRSSSPKALQSLTHKSAVKTASSDETREMNKAVTGLTVMVVVHLSNLPRQGRVR